MTLIELRMLFLIGFVATTIVAMLVVLGVAALVRLVRDHGARIARARALVSRAAGDGHRDTAPPVARGVEDRQAMGRLPC